jgi:AcrR family transcriptional regulator
MGQSKVGLPPSRRPMRADARRNYDALIGAAELAFAKDGAAASLDAIAREAGVGTGTLYRHFPNRQSLLQAVYVEKLAEIAEQAYTLAEGLPPYEALRAWVREVALHTLGFRGLKELIALEGGDADDAEWCRTAMRTATGFLLTAAQEAGDVRADVEPIDLLRLVHGVALSVDYVQEAEKPAAMDRMLALVLDGLRPAG